MTTQRISPDESPPRPPWAVLKNWLRLVIIVLVVVGMWQAVDRSLRELDRRSQAIEERIERLQHARDEARDPQRAAALAEQIGALQRQRPGLSEVRWMRLAAAGLCYALALVPGAIFWHAILLSLAQRPHPARSIPGHLVGHLGKYVPGKALVVVMRAGAVSGPRVSFAAAALAAVVETLTMMAVGGALAGVLVLLLPAPTWIRWLALGLTVAAVVPTAPPIFRRVVFVLSRGRAAAVFRGNAEALSWRLMLTGWGWLLAGWLGIGLAFFLVLHSLPSVADGPVGPADLALATAAIALAIVAGFVSLLPGGAGVRELVLTSLLAPRFGAPTALAAALLARVVFLGAELVLAVVAKTAARWLAPDRSEDEGAEREGEAGGKPRQAAPLLPGQSPPTAP